MHRQGRTVAGATLLAAVAACAPPPGEAPQAAQPAADAAHAAEIERWRQDREERLRKPDGWFSLVGLTWLTQGETTVGSDPASGVLLPASAPAEVGVILLENGEAELAATPGVALTVDGESRPRSLLTTDADGAASVVEVGTVMFHLIDRDGRIGVRVKDSRSPALLAFHGLEYYPVDPRWRVEARFVAYDPPRPIAVPTVLGTTSEQPSPGAVEFRAAGGDHRLDVLPGGDGEVFIVFGDETNGPETYGGGRFLYAAEADAAGRVVLDFNQAYNPPCAFTPHATCPLPPRQNRLGLAVRAGEKKYAGGVEH